MTNVSPARLISRDMDYLSFPPNFQRQKREAYKTLIHLVNFRFGCHSWCRRLIS